jgi:hypothetical protein
MPQNLEELKINIQDACESIGMKMLSVFGMRVIVYALLHISLLCTAYFLAYFP